MSAGRGGADVVVIGGGVIGCAIAWRLAQRGCDVVVLERGTPGGEATWAAGGMLSPLAEAAGPGPFLELGLASLRRYPAFVQGIEEAAGLEVGYAAAPGKLLVPLDDGDADALRRRAEWQRAAGFEVEEISGDAARSLEPALSPRALAALLIRRDQHVDNRLLGRAAWLAASRAGVRFDTGTSAERLRIERADGRRRFVAVETADGARVAGDAVVLAAGAWSGGIGALPRPLPVFPVRGQMVALEHVPPLLRHVVETADGYLIPRTNGRLVVGATSEEVGFRRAVTPEGLRGLLDAAIRALPALATAKFLETWVGFRPATRDALPVLGADPDVAGLFYATGHFRNGILLAPITADAIAAAVAGDAPPIDLAPFAVDRFEAEETADVGTAGAARCEACGAVMLERHCKLVCPRCGYVRDCSDP